MKTQCEFYGFKFEHTPSNELGPVKKHADYRKKATCSHPQNPRQGKKIILAPIKCGGDKKECDFRFFLE